MYLLDTDILIDIQRGHAPAITWFASLSQLPSVPNQVRGAIAFAKCIKVLALLLYKILTYAIFWGYF